MKSFKDMFFKHSLMKSFKAMLFKHLDSLLKKMDTCSRKQYEEVVELTPPK